MSPTLPSFKYKNDEASFHFGFFFISLETWNVPLLTGKTLEPFINSYPKQFPTSPDFKWMHALIVIIIFHYEKSFEKLYRVFNENIPRRRCKNVPETVLKTWWFYF